LDEIGDMEGRLCALKIGRRNSMTSEDKFKLLYSRL